MHCEQDRAGGKAEGHEGKFAVLHSVLLMKRLRVAIFKMIVGGLLPINSLGLVRPAKDEKVDRGMEFELLLQASFFLVTSN
jgi:hypothetical protein